MSEPGDIDLDLDAVRVVLLERRREAAERLRGAAGEHAAVIAAARDTATDDEHDPEGATIAYERGLLDVLARGLRETVADIDLALARLDRGDYPVCERCGRDIGAARLEALPTARRCRQCAGR